MTAIERHKYLWDGSAPEWVLVRDGPGSYAVYNRKDRTALIIEDEREYAAVVNNMLRAGVEVLDELPKE